jgi:class 3 adenylate cyclase/tetratricopeptide (TPR) repeat protein
MNPPGMRFCGHCGERLPLAAPVEQAGDERRMVTTLFADLVGFTGIAEQLDPEEVKWIMDTTLGRLAAIVEQYEGTVDKFAGDNIMARFGAPRSHEDDAERAVRAALDMQHALAQLSAEFEPRTHAPLLMRIGVNTGEVLAGTVGAGPGRDYTVMGDAVNVAARLEQAAAPGQVLVGQMTYHAAWRAFDWHELAPLVLKGKAEPLACWEPLATRDSRTTGRDIRGQGAPLIGREPEMAALSDLYAGVIAGGAPQLGILMAPAGTGKTRLAAEFQRALAQHSGAAAPRWLRGRCLPYGQDITFWALAEILKTCCGILDNDSRAVAHQKLAAGVRHTLGAAGAADAGRVIDRLAYTIGLAGKSDVPGGDLPSMRQELFGAWRTFFTALARQRPLVLVFEDIHWADPGLLELIGYLLETPAPAPWLLLALTRPDLFHSEQRPRWATHARARLFDLPPLTGAQSLLLGKALLNGRLPAEVDALIQEKAEGNPYYVEELLRMLLEEGVLALSPGASGDAPRWRLTRPLGAVRVPPTLHGLLAARIDRLPEFERDLIRQGAVVGRVFWLGVLRALYPGRSFPELVHGVRSLQAQGLVSAQPESTMGHEPEYTFTHSLVRDVAYGMLPKARRSESHNRVARWFEEVTAGRRDEYLDLVAYHWEQAALLRMDLPAMDPDGTAALRRRAIATLREAGEKAQARQLYDSARGFYDRALRLAAPPVSGGEPADLPAGEGADLLPSPHGFLDLLCLHAQCLQELDDCDPALAELQQVLAATEARAARGDIEWVDLRAKALYQLSRIAADRGDWDQAEEQANLALALARAVRDTGLQANILRTLGRVAHFRGDLAAARRFYEQALEIYRLVSDRSREALILWSIGQTYQDSGAADRAMACLQQAAGLFDALGHRRSKARVLRDLGMGAYWHGDLQTAELQLREGLSLAEEVGDATNQADCQTYLGVTLTALDQLATAEELLRASVEIYRAHHDRPAEAVALYYLGNVYLQQDALEPAETVLQESLAICLKIGQQLSLPEPYRLLSELRLRQGDLPGARSYGEQACAAVADEDYYSQATTARSLAMALAAAGDFAGARGQFEVSMTACRRAGLCLELAVTCLEYATWLREADPAGAATYLAEAQGLLNSSRAKLYEQRMAALLTQTVALADAATVSQEVSAMANEHDRGHGRHGHRGPGSDAGSIPRELPETEDEDRWEARGHGGAGTDAGSIPREFGARDDEHEGRERHGRGGDRGVGTDAGSIPRE